MIALTALYACNGCDSRKVVVRSPAPAASSAPNALPPASPGAALAGLDPQLDVRPLLDDPRLAAAARAARGGDQVEAAAALAAAVSALPAGSPELPRWRYQLGRLEAAARHDEAAAQAFADSADAPWPLAPYAALGAAQALTRLGRVDEARMLAERVPDGLPITPTARLLAAEGYERQNDLPAAAALWRAYLQGPKRPGRWADVSLRLARARLADAGDAGAALEALTLARAVAREVPTGSLNARAQELEQKALEAMSPAERRAHAATPFSDRLARAQSLHDAQKWKEADAAVTALEAALTPAQRSSEIGCKVASLAGQIKAKKKDRPAAADRFGDAIDRCRGDALAAALYAGGKASTSAGRNAEADARFERVEREMGSHRLADDARLKRAELALDRGDSARFVALLEPFADDYPEGDMASDALVRLALYHIGRNDWRAALPPLEKARARPRAGAASSAGRAAYFRARALLALGERARGTEALREVVQNNPLSYYMVQAYARLAALDPAGAPKLLEPPPGDGDAVDFFRAPDHPVFASEGFARARELLAQGENDSAQGELGALGALGTGSELPAEVTRALALLLGRAGAFVQAQAMQRRLGDWPEHYPAGRWYGPWSVAYPRPYLDVVEREAAQSGTPAPLAYAIMREESAFDPSVVSAAHAYGLMQLIVPTAQSVGKKIGLAVNEDALKQPPVNIALGCRFLSDLRGRFPDNPALAVPAYNAGPGAPKRWLESRPDEPFDLFVEAIPYEETRNYTKRVLASYAAYTYLYDRPSFALALRLPERATGRVAAAPPPAPGPSPAVAPPPAYGAAPAVATPPAPSPAANP
ncbi:MAG: lytic transglycosylase domain-containing protein [Polyangiaceae bacterium]|nr:lytic transglycosylase domain-containing protein [Polyangiaceae bacterium]